MKFDFKDWLRTRNRLRVYKRLLKKACSEHPDGFLFSGRGQMMAKGGFEPFEVVLVKKLLREVELFVNIGAHHGFYSCLALSRNISTVAYEPEATNIEMIRKHVEANSFTTSFKLHPCAVGSSSGELTLYGGGSGGSLLEDNLNGAPKGQQQKVAIVTLDDTLELKGKKALCLMDVEGFEHEALKGCKTILSSDDKPYWIIEVWTKNSSDEPNHTFSEVFSLMESHGYRYWGIDEGATTLAPLTADMVRGIEQGKVKITYSNFLFIPDDDDLAFRLHL